MKRRVVLVDDHELFLAGVRSELGDAVEVVGEAASVADAVPLIKELDPDVVFRVRGRAPAATVHGAELQTMDGQRLWSITIFDGTTSFTLPGLSPDPLPLEAISAFIRNSNPSRVIPALFTKISTFPHSLST